MQELLVEARRAWVKEGHIPYRLSTQLELWGINVPLLERNWSEGKV